MLRPERGATDGPGAETGLGEVARAEGRNRRDPHDVELGPVPVDARVDVVAEVRVHDPHGLGAERDLVRGDREVAGVEGRSNGPDERVDADGRHDLLGDREAAEGEAGHRVTPGARLTGACASFGMVPEVDPDRGVPVPAVQPLGRHEPVEVGCRTRPFP